MIFYNQEVGRCQRWSSTNKVESYDSRILEILTKYNKEEKSTRGKNFSSFKFKFKFKIFAVFWLKKKVPCGTLWPVFYALPKTLIKTRFANCAYVLLVRGHNYSVSLWVTAPKAIHVVPWSVVHYARCVKGGRKTMLYLVIHAGHCKPFTCKGKRMVALPLRPLRLPICPSACPCHLGRGRCSYGDRRNVFASH